MWLEMQLCFAVEGEQAGASSYWATLCLARAIWDGCTCYLQSVYRGVVESRDVYQTKCNSLFLLLCPFSVNETTAGVIKDEDSQGVKPYLMGTRWCCDWHTLNFTTTTVLFLQLATHFGLWNCCKAAPGHGGIALPQVGLRMDFVQVLVSVS